MTVTALVRCVRGLEWVAADELQAAVGPERTVQAGHRELAVQMPDEGLAGLAGLRCADDVLIRVGATVGPIRGEPATELVRRLDRLDWSAAVDAIRGVRPVPQQPRIDVVAAVTGLRRFTRFDVEQAVGPVLAGALGGRYLARGPGGMVAGSAGRSVVPAGRSREPADLTLRLFVGPDQVVAAVRLGVAPLHRRGYKLDTGPGTLHPPVAAAIARLAGPLDGLTVLDPFCGDGTIPIEAALAAGSATVTGTDLDPVRLAHARANRDRAGVRLELRTEDAVVVEGDRVDRVLTNPPWNLTVDAAGGLVGSLARFWRGLPARLSPGGLVCALTQADLDVPAALVSQGFAVGLSPRLRVAGRVLHLILAAAPGAEPPVLTRSMVGWRDRMIESGVVTREGF